MKDTTLPKKRKKRADEGKPRNKYDNTLPPRYLKYIKRAAAKSIPFELSVEEFELMCEQDCTYCGQSGYSIDRIDSSKGYIKGNIAPCCTLCNQMKWSNPLRTFLKHIEKIYLHNNSH